MLLFSLYLFLSLLILTNQNRENKVVKKVVYNELYKYHYSAIIDGFFKGLIEPFK